MQINNPHSSTISDKGVFRGYAGVFNHLDSQKDIILPGAFSESIRTRNVILLWQHDYKEPVGKVMHLQENSFGLLVTAQLNLALSKAKDVHSLIKERIIGFLSIGYKCISSRKHPHNGSRILQKIDLWEISIVTFPSNRLSKIIEV